MNPTITKAMEIHEREDTLRRATAAYDAGDPFMSDAEFDQTWRIHQADRNTHPNLFPVDTILETVGQASTTGFTKVAHSSPMLSLDNVFEAEEGSLKSWLDGVTETAGGQIGITLELKVDGIAIRILYVDGVLTQAVTRGDGFTGDDVTANVVAAKLAPEFLPFANDGVLELVGEIYINRQDFERMNAERAKVGLQLWKNPRNAAAGAMKLQDPAEVAERGLSLIIHGVTKEDAETIKFQAFLHEATKTWRMRSAYVQTVLSGCSEENLLGDVRSAKEIAERQGIPIDGLVFKVNSFESRKDFGTTSRAPRWAVALKFYPEQMSTTLKAITVQVGKSGKLTPVAELEPVDVDGSTVARATLHNEDQVNRLKLVVGGRVIVQKAGAVIPEITGMDPAQPTGKFVPYDLLKAIDNKCPSCSQRSVRKGRNALAEGEESDEVGYYCHNPECPSQIAGRMLHFGSREALNLAYLGDVVAEALTAGFVESQGENCAVHGEEWPSTIKILLDMCSVWTLPAFADTEWETDRGRTKLGEVRGKKLLQSIQDAKKLPLDRWIYALGLPTIGRNTSKELTRLCQYAYGIELACKPEGIIGCIAAGEDKSSEFLAPYQVSGRIGPDSARRLVEFFDSADGEMVLKWLFRHEIKSDNFNPKPVSKGGSLEGKTLVVTGTLSRGRKEIEKMITDAGGKCSGSVSKKTDFLVVGEDAGSKLTKAKELGVPILDEPALLAML